MREFTGVIDDMFFTIDHGATPLITSFAKVLDRVASCGSINYSLVSGHLKVGSVDLTVLSDSRTIHVYTNSGYDVGVYDFIVLAELEDYHSLSPIVSIILPFKVTIDSVCELTMLL